MTTTLTALAMQVHAAELRADAAAENAVRAMLHGLDRTTRQHLSRLRREALAAAATARAAYAEEYTLRHDLHVAEDFCPECGDRAYDLYSPEATDEERAFAASVSADAAAMLGLSA